MTCAGLRKSAQGQAAEEHYARFTSDFYLSDWHPDHIHFGVFEPEDHIDFSRPQKRPFAGLTRALERMIDEVTEPAGIRSDQHVVDVGCGVGGTARRLASRCGCRVTGVNISALQLDIARRRTREDGLDGLVDFRAADASVHLPFPDGSVDVVVNIESACYYGDRPQYLREVRRILKPGGRLVALDWLMNDQASPAEREAYIRPLCSAWVMPNLESRSSYLRLLREAGLETDGVSDFGGRDRYNAELFGRRARLMFARRMSGTPIPEFWIEGTEMLSTVHAAWSRGCFELGRYCARRPPQ